MPSSRNRQTFRISPSGASRTPGNAQLFLLSNGLEPSAALPSLNLIGTCTRLRIQAEGDKWLPVRQEGQPAHHCIGWCRLLHGLLLPAPLLKQCLHLKLACCPPASCVIAFRLWFTLLSDGLLKSRRDNEGICWPPSPALRHSKS